MNTHNFLQRFGGLLFWLAVIAGTGGFIVAVVFGGAWLFKALVAS